MAESCALGHDLGVGWYGAHTSRRHRAHEPTGDRRGKLRARGHVRHPTRRVARGGGEHQNTEDERARKHAGGRRARGRAICGAHAGSTGTRGEGPVVRRVGASTSTLFRSAALSHAAAPKCHFQNVRSAS